jgi:hypothetical protein
VIDDAERTRADPDGERRPRSNRGFWIVVTSIAVVALVTLVAILANRPLKDTIAHTESDLRGALELARRIEASTGSFAGADAVALGDRDDARRYVGPDEGSDGPGTVSVYAAPDVWAAAVEARPDACFFIKQAVGAETAYAVATGACTGRAALAASDDRW